MEEGLSTIKRIKSNMSKICFNKSNKLNADFKDDQIEIILDNKNITPKPIYFNFQEAETKKSFDQIDDLLKYFDEKNEHDNKNDSPTKSKEEEKVRDLPNENLIEILEKKHRLEIVNRKGSLKQVQYEKDILESYDAILLTETETINLLDIPNILNDVEADKKRIEDKNGRYEKLLNNDESNYINKSMQTLNVFKKNKDVYVSTINKQNKSTQTNLYELHKLTIRSPSDIAALLHKKFLKYRNKKLKKIMDEYGDSLNINERVILKKNMWVQVVDKNIIDNKQTTIIPKSFYKSKKNNTSLFNTLFSTKNMSRTLSNKSRTFRTRNKFKNMKTMKFLTSSFSEDEYLIKSIIKKKKEQNEDPEEVQENIDENANAIPWKINSPKKNINKATFVEILKTIEKYVVQNIYYYEQFLYKNIYFSHLKDNRKGNNIKMFDGENYDALTNPNISYKKKKIIIRTKIKRNYKRIINLKKNDQNFDHTSNKGAEEKNDTSSEQVSLIPFSIANLIKKHLTFLSKGKKKKIEKKILASQLRKKIRKKIKKKKEKKKSLIISEKGEDINTDLHILNGKIHNYELQVEKKKSRENPLQVCDTKRDHEIFDIITNEESNEDKIKKISTLIIDDVLKSNNKEENKKEILEKENVEKRRISYVLKKKEKFTTISGNRIKLSRQVKQDDHSYGYSSDRGMLHRDNETREEVTQNERSNALYRSRGKKYIKNICIDKLFQFHYNKLEKIVTSIDTNKFYEDYITASYSNTLDIGNFQNSKGNIAIFSFINPTYPIKLFNINASIMKIKYSDNNPNILVAALCNGHVYIYDIRNGDTTPVLKSTTIKNYYENCFEPIYDFSFKNSYMTNNNSESVFYSAHENGFVYQWNIEKELKNKEILYLKNKKNDLYQDLSSVFENKNLSNKPFNSSLTCIDIDTYMHHDEDFVMNNLEEKASTDFNHKGKHHDERSENGSGGKGEESRGAPPKLISHVIGEGADADYSKGTSKEEELLNHYKNITENIIDKKIKPTHSYYYLGTKNGLIYRCNSCYQKSYLNYYVAHFGSVNKVKINPFDHDIFLSAGEDCTVKLWNKFSNKQITTFKSKNSFSSINDILWLPNNSTSFFCCSDDGRVELWDFDFLSKDPLIIFYPNVVESSKILSLKMFNRNDVLLCGDNLANISMMKVKNLFNVELDDYEQKGKLTKCLKYLDTYDYF
ncbi:hypothetical protein, conserved [Plasmodium ovale wallikeri]|uniref:Uncharacterized protein n=1 Tax=Plasmodium ovale wallikeri TaxID=864142 RepID=A0A1A8ZY57_PLAOA|nr:hypothetical protein, conserved [Plasmodium ovale wallikeri]SBT48823.1 hypothetical protein, conserved [Plasmodium ovale wallikeri]